MEFSISLNDLQFFHTLGKGKWYTGSFGRVQLGLIKHLNQYVAVKIIKKSSVLCRKDIEHLLSEFSIMKLIKHPFIINLHGICQNRRYLCFILEYVPGGNLFHYLRTIGKLENSHACVYAAQMIIAIEYLHSIDIIYRDLKPENILISSDGYLKLADFGFAKSVENRTYTLCGTPEYTAPEIILHKGHGKSVDWWSFGILIFEMLAGIDPFSTKDPTQIYSKILKAKINFPKNFNPRAKNLVKHLVTNDTNKRYDLNQIKSHAWFESINWCELYNKELVMPYVPVLRDPTDNSYLPIYPDSFSLGPEICPNFDPFRDW